MADTIRTTEEEKKEHFDSPEVLDQKIEQLATWVRESEHFIAFTGAGISTSTGIPDFRSGVNTVLKTGAGAWEKRAIMKKGGKVEKKGVAVSSLKAVPSKTHMALVKLVEEGLMKFLISQNTDGLHRRSGVNPGRLAELHGNSNMEKCKKCKKEYMRDSRVRNAQKVHDHETGRLCDNPVCGGKLRDTIINFGENLPDKELNNGFDNAQLADVCLAMGSSLTVTPAANMPETVADRGGKLIIVNLQKTPLDSIASLRINAMCDTVIEKLMAKLELEIPDFKLNRRLLVKKIKNSSGRPALTFTGVDSDKAPYSLFTHIKMKIDGVEHSLKKEPFQVSVAKYPEAVNVKLHFQGHYNEPSFTVPVTLNNMKIGDEKVFLMTYDPRAQQWEDCFPFEVNGEIA